MSRFEKILKYLPTVIFALALLVWGGVGYLYLAQKQPQPLLGLPSLSLPSISLSTLTWKTYQNDFLSFELKYPPGLTYTVNSPQKPTVWEQISFISSDNSKGENSFTMQINQVSPQNHKVFNLASQTTADNPAVYEEESKSGGKRTIVIAPVEIKDITWVKQTIIENNQTFLVYMTTQKKDQRVYTITFTGPDKSSEEIIQTFVYTQT